MQSSSMVEVTGQSSTLQVEKLHANEKKENVFASARYGARLEF